MREDLRPELGCWERQHLLCAAYMVLRVDQNHYRQLPFFGIAWTWSEERVVIGMN
jgi:hypothetical protein